MRTRLRGNNEMGSGVLVQSTLPSQSCVAVAPLNKPSTARGSVAFIQRVGCVGNVLPCLKQERDEHTEHGPSTISIKKEKAAPIEF